jgi:uncharacterized integral membrane protein (TIGR00698 family)
LSKRVPLFDPVAKPGRKIAVDTVFSRGNIRIGIGLVVIGAITLAATLLADGLGIPVMLSGLFCGMFFLRGPLKRTCEEAVPLTARTALRLGVALLGVRISLADIAFIGWHRAGFLIVAVVLSIGAGIGIARIFRLHWGVGIISACAVSICGASAALAASSALPPGSANERETAYVVMTVTVLSTVAMVLYPLLVGFLRLDDTTAGIFFGGTIHDIAQVVAAGYGISEQAGSAATLAKFVRIGCLLPAVAVITLISRRNSGSQHRPPLLPGFLIGFTVLLGLNSVGAIPQVAVPVLAGVSQFLLLAAMVAIGGGTTVTGIFSEGWRPLAVILTQTVMLAAIVFVGVGVLIR